MLELEPQVHAKPLAKANRGMSLKLEAEVFLGRLGFRHGSGLLVRRAGFIRVRRGIALLSPRGNRQENEKPEAGGDRFSHLVANLPSWAVPTTKQISIRPCRWPSVAG